MTHAMSCKYSGVVSNIDIINAQHSNKPCTIKWSPFFSETNPSQEVHLCINIYRFLSDKYLNLGGMVSVHGRRLWKCKLSYLSTDTIVMFLNDLHFIPVVALLYMLTYIGAIRKMILTNPQDFCPIKMY